MDVLTQKKLDRAITTFATSCVTGANEMLSQKRGELATLYTVLGKKVLDTCTSVSELNDYQELKDALDWLVTL